MREIYNTSMLKTSFNIVEIVECDNKDVATHQKVEILVLNNYVLICLVILNVVVMKLDTILTCLTELVDNKHGLTHYILQVSMHHSCLLQWLLVICCIR
jgi:hypothetical protein